MLANCGTAKSRKREENARGSSRLVFPPPFIRRVTMARTMQTRPTQSTLPVHVKYHQRMKEFLASRQSTMQRIRTARGLNAKKIVRELTEEGSDEVLRCLLDEVDEDTEAKLLIQHFRERASPDEVHCFVLDSYLAFLTGGVQIPYESLDFDVTLFDGQRYFFQKLCIKRQSQQWFYLANANPKSKHARNRLRFGSKVSHTLSILGNFFSADVNLHLGEDYLVSNLLTRNCQFRELPLIKEMEQVLRMIQRLKHMRDLFRSVARFVFERPVMHVLQQLHPQLGL